MCKFLSTKIYLFLIVSILAASSGCSSIPVRDEEQYGVSIARYNAHTAASNLETLHRIQINDISGLRENLEDSLANDVNLLWSAVINKRTSKEEQDRAYSMLRLIAVQNEKFPIRTLSNDTEIMEILVSAIQNDLAHTEQLRRQDWSKPKWENRVK